MDNKLLVSLQHCWDFSANMQIFDISKQGQAIKVYSFEEVLGGNNPNIESIALVLFEYLFIDRSFKGNVNFLFKELDLEM